MASASAVVTLRMLPTKQLLVTFAPGAAIQMTSLAVVTAMPAPAPKAVLAEPVLLGSALAPTAVLLPPSVLLMSA